MIEITREQLGFILGWFLLVLILVGVPYLSVSFVTWSFDPSTWRVIDRAGVLVLALAMIFARFLYSRLRVIDEPEERR